MDGKSPTYLFAYNGRVDNIEYSAVLDYLISKGGNVEDFKLGYLNSVYQKYRYRGQSVQDQSALIHGCKNGTLKLFDAKILLEDLKQDLDRVYCNKSFRFLYYFVRKGGSEDVLAYLISKSSASEDEIKRIPYQLERAKPRRRSRVTRRQRRLEMLINQEQELFLLLERRRQLRAAITSGFSTNYDPIKGFTVFFDFATDIPSRYKQLQVVYCFAVEQEVRTKVRATQVADCKMGSGGMQQCVIGAIMHFEKVPAIANTRCVLELQTVGAKINLGWYAFDLFLQDSVSTHLNTGLHKLPLQRGRVNDHRFDKQCLPMAPHISMHVRLCNHVDVETFKNMPLDPVIAGPKYTYIYQIRE
eukprot:g3092.t1